MEFHTIVQYATWTKNQKIYGQKNEQENCKIGKFKLIQNGWVKVILVNLVKPKFQNWF